MKFKGLNEVCMLNMVFTRLLKFFCLTGGLLAALASCKGPGEAELAYMRSLSAPGAGIWPDYAGCCVPVNIAPLNFYVLPPHSGFELRLYGNGPDTLRLKGRHRVRFPEKAWRKLLEENLHGRVFADIRLERSRGQDSCMGFSLTVEDAIDRFMTCRLIEPVYQNSALLQTIETDLETARTRFLFDNRLQETGCENCHTYAQNEGDYLVYHVRFNRTGTFIVTPDSVVRVDLKCPDFPMGGVYPSWHPGKRLIAFGTSSAYPFVHSKDHLRRTEVYDSLGDILLYDIARNVILSDRRMAGKDSEETFPCWSPDGKSLFFCQAANPPRDSMEDDTEFAKKIKYSLIRASFDEETGRFGRFDTLIDAAVTGKTVSFPRVSPDGRFVVFCLSDHGTFPIRHPESDLYLLDLTPEKAFPARAFSNPAAGSNGRQEDGKASKNGPDPDAGPVPDSPWLPTGSSYPMRRMEHVNSPFSESYHAWSSNGEWLLFSSKRGDNFYARPYFCHVDSAGRSSKPFLLPQEDPALYLSFLKSFNVPELSRTPARISASKAKDYSLLPVKKPAKVVWNDGGAAR